MGTYKAKMLIDEKGEPFVPLTGGNAVYIADGDQQRTVESVLDDKINSDDLTAEDGVLLTKTGAVYSFTLDSEFVDALVGEKISTGSSKVYMGSGDPDPSGDYKNGDLYIDMAS